MLTRASKRGFSSLATALKSNALIDIHLEVAEALNARKPVVALESTIITHGMPYPVNLETARSVERNVRTSGSIPATIGLIDGRVKIGLAPHELERLAERRNEPVKLSRRDIGAAIALKRDGGTTCSATLIFAALAGIKVRDNRNGNGSNLTLRRSSRREGTLFAPIRTCICHLLFVFLAWEAFIVWAKTVGHPFAFLTTRTEPPLVSPGYLCRSARVNEMSCRACLGRSKVYSRYREVSVPDTFQHPRISCGASVGR